MLRCGFGPSLACLMIGLLAGQAVRADDAPPAARPGFRNVAIKQGGRTSYIQVQDVEPYRNVKDSSGDSADGFSFNRPSPLAHQRYDIADTASSHDNGSYRQETERTFQTQSYFRDVDGSSDRATPGLHTSVPVNGAEGYASQATGFDRRFLTAQADVDQNKTAGDARTSSDYQGLSATTGGHEVKTFASPMSSQTFEGPEAELVRRDLSKMSEGLAGMKDIPKRALTIDEVRSLINHGVKPETDEKPPEPSKALNDPDYTPDPAPAPLRVQPGEEHHLIDDNDVIPPPGEMVHSPNVAPAPENSEPLPH